MLKVRMIEEALAHTQVIDQSLEHSGTVEGIIRKLGAQGFINSTRDIEYPRGTLLLLLK